MSITYRIGTRDSQLALWQATRIQHLLKKSGINTVLVPVKSEGDLDLTTPLYAMGVQGIFTRSLDQALLNNQIDLAVHSMKDVPVQLPKGIVEAAVPERDNPYDLLAPRQQLENTFLEDHRPALIGSSSLRRRSQWLHRFPQDSIAPIRGNVNTRLKKLAESNWSGAIFAAAGLERIGLRPQNAIELSWMLPAPAQGALLVVCRENDEPLLSSCAKLHDERTAFCAHIERDFLSALMGGCSTPVGALAEIENEELLFQGNLTSTDGKKQVTIEKRISLELAASLGTSAARELLEEGGMAILKEIKHA
ncbi:MAG: hydroxymethylbilane synthase [Bacteroidota bacterium]|nr:hydroxymethylbilane synthase [Bacteroidota bacterium]MDP4211582.1 hydroxymethylbilane synthase [Bacteroidota bacterium]MDP4249111.1 hydroxymethylbilane synthase [Bacteroidota bacterium]